MILKFIPIIPILIFLLFTNSLWANLQVVPTRVVLTDDEKNGYLTVRNKATTTKTFKIIPVFYRQSADSSLTIVETPSAEEHSLIPLLRFSPRTVTVGPDQSQTVRIMLIKKNNFEDGDYRAHFRVAEIETPQGTSGNTENAIADKKMNFNLVPRLAISVPVVYISKNSQFTLSFDNLEFIPASLDGKKSAYLKCKIIKNGNGIALGKIKFMFKAKDSTPESPAVEVGLIDGFSSYIAERQDQLVINNSEKIKLEKGKITIQFISDSIDNKTKEMKVFEKSLEI
jgi:hypothetical protein